MCVRPVTVIHVSTPIAIFATDAPTAAMMIPFLPPILSTNGPLMRNENPYVIVPAAKMRPKSSFVIRSPNPFFATVRL